MPHRSALTLGIVVLADALAWILTVHATATYHAVGAAPSVMSLGDLVGWFVSVGLLIVIVLMLLARRGRRRLASRGR